MRVTEQIDALRRWRPSRSSTWSCPRVLASVLMMPLLVVMGDVVGMYGRLSRRGATCSGANPGAYYENSFQSLDMNDFTVGLIKAAVFGLIFSVVACVRGYLHRRAARRASAARRRGRSSSASLAILLVRLLPDEAALLSAAAGAGARSSGSRTSARRSAARPVLDRVDLSVAEGESLVIVGPSGTGKSVLLKHLIGLLHPDCGQVFVDGVDLWSLDEVERNAFRKKFGMSFQEGALFDSMNVFDNMAFPLRRSGRSPAQIRARVEECLELVHLPDVGGKQPSSSRAACGGASGSRARSRSEPEILLFDEPNTGLDPIMTDVIAEVILEMRQASCARRSSRSRTTWRARGRSATGSRCSSEGRSSSRRLRRSSCSSSDPAVRQFVEGKAPRAR